jgi:glutaredoxin
MRAAILLLAVIWTVVSVGCLSSPEPYVDQNVSVIIPNAITSTDVLVNFNQTMRHVNGTETSASILVFGLSACHACQETKTTLNDVGVEYWWIDIDMLNPKMSNALYSSAGMMGVCHDIPSAVPVILKGTTCVTGYKAEVIRGLAMDGES